MHYDGLRLVDYAADKMSGQSDVDKTSGETQVLKTLIDQLTKEQRQLLHEFGVDSSMLSRWRTGKRLPTEPQTDYLARITGADIGKLRDEISYLRATPEQRAMLKRVAGKLARGAGVTLSFGAAVAVGFAAWADRVTTMYRVQRG